jgi:hypothetical protein
MILPLLLPPGGVGGRRLSLDGVVPLLLDDEEESVSFIVFMVIVIIVLVCGWLGCCLFWPVVVSNFSKSVVFFQTSARAQAALCRFVV